MGVAVNSGLRKGTEPETSWVEIIASELREDEELGIRDR